MHPATGLVEKTLVTALLLAVLVTDPAATASAGEQDAPAITHGQADAILDELKVIRGLLEKIEQQGLARGGRPARATSATLELDDTDPALGKADAPVTVIEFTDFQCPYCKRFIQTTFPQLRRDYIDSGKLRWIVRDLPMSFHPEARKAGQAAHCAGEQGKYWEMREILFGNSPKLAISSMPGYAQIIGLDVAAFNDCLASERHLADMDKDMQTADGVRITGTPTFIIGTAKGNSLSGRLVIGAQAQQVFTAEIDRLLKEHDGN
jgi:protein-disulfide isomerase